MPANKKDQLVDTALRLFSSEGYHATGIDRVISESGVARMTLYNHFKSKDELILAVLRRRDENFRNWMMRTVEKKAKTPKNQLLAVFDALGDWFNEKSFSGCMFINAAAEFADPGNPIHRLTAEHKILLRDYLKDLAVKAGATEPEKLADGLMLLMEGAIVMRYVADDRKAAGTAKTTAMVLTKEAGL